MIINVMNSITGDSFSRLLLRNSQSYIYNAKLIEFVNAHDAAIRKIFNARMRFTYVFPQRFHGHA